MNYELKNKALRLTQELLCEYWHGKPEKFLSLLDEDVLWIGSMDSEYIHGAENIRKRINENANEMVDVCLKNEEYEVAYSDPKCCLVVGRYTAYTKPETGIVLSENQRVTFQWIVKNNQLKIIHLHLSNILHIQEEEEKFPIIAGKTTFEYVKMLLQREKGFSKIYVRDVKGVTMIIHDYDIIYVKSDGNNIEINCQDKVIKCHDTLKNFSKKLSEFFIPVGRCYIINTDNVISVDNTYINMLNDYKVKIPVKSVKEITQKIRNNLVL